MKKGPSKNRITNRVRYANIGGLLLVVVIVTIAAATAMTRIARSASMSLAYVHAREAVANFNLHVRGELSLLRKAASADAVRVWFADEGDTGKRAVAFDELMVFAASLESAEFYFGIKASLNEYAVDIDTAFADFAPYGQMVYGDPMDAWFFNWV